MLPLVPRKVAMAHRRLAHIDIATEVETGHGWSYELTLAYDDAGESHHTRDLSWVDYEDWSGGDKPPSLVAERLLEAGIEHPDRTGTEPVREPKIAAATNDAQLECDRVIELAESQAVPLDQA